ncbi:hypothetical protein PENTCL1PPCAC_21634, partial [Pristionchus entomophagus]
ITSPGFPFNASTPCDYYLMVEEGKKVELEVRLSWNSCCDSLIVYDGYFGGIVMANLTGEVSNTTYTTTTSNIMQVSWVPNGGVNVLGLAVSPKATEATVKRELSPDYSPAPGSVDSPASEPAPATFKQPITPDQNDENREVRLESKDQRLMRNSGNQICRHQRLASEANDTDVIHTFRLRNTKSAGTVGSGPGNARCGNDSHLSHVPLADYRILAGSRHDNSVAESTSTHNQRFLAANALQQPHAFARRKSAETGRPLPILSCSHSLPFNSQIHLVRLLIQQRRITGAV